MWALEAGFPVSTGWGKEWRPEGRELCRAQCGEEGRTPGGKVTGNEAREKGSVMPLGVQNAKLWVLLRPECWVVTEGLRAEWHGQICILAR